MVRLTDQIVLAIGDMVIVSLRAGLCRSAGRRADRRYRALVIRLALSARRYRPVVFGPSLSARRYRAGVIGPSLSGWRYRAGVIGEMLFRPGIEDRCISSALRWSPLKVLLSHSCRGVILHLLIRGSPTLAVESS